MSKRLSYEEKYDRLIKRSKKLSHLKWVCNIRNIRYDIKIFDRIKTNDNGFEYCFKKPNIFISKICNNRDTWHGELSPRKYFDFIEYKGHIIPPIRYGLFKLYYKKGNTFYYKNLYYKLKIEWPFELLEYSRDINIDLSVFGIDFFKEEIDKFKKYIDSLQNS